MSNTASTSKTSRTSRSAPVTLIPHLMLLFFPIHHENHYCGTGPRRLLGRASAGIRGGIGKEGGRALKDFVDKGENLHQPGPRLRGCDWRGIQSACPQCARRRRRTSAPQSDFNIPGSLLRVNASPPRKSGRTPTGKSTSSSPASAPGALLPGSGGCSRPASLACQFVGVEPEDSPDARRGRRRPPQDSGHRRQLHPRDPRHGRFTTRSSTSRRRPRSVVAPAGTEEGMLVRHLLRRRVSRARQRGRLAPGERRQDPSSSVVSTSASATSPPSLFEGLLD